MVDAPTSPVLLAIDAGVRETGWAIFSSSKLVTTGVFKGPNPRRIDATTRVSHQLQCLDRLVAEWQPCAVAHSQPSGIHWPVPALELLRTALVGWSRRQRLPVFCYRAEEVRAAIAGHPNVPRDQLGYAVMVRLGLVGHSKTTHEWEAIAVGEYHLDRVSHRDAEAQRYN